MIDTGILPEALLKELASQEPSCFARASEGPANPSDFRGLGVSITFFKVDEGSFVCIRNLFKSEGFEVIWKRTSKHELHAPPS